MVGRQLCCDTIGISMSRTGELRDFWHMTGAGPAPVIAV
jgi:hypothetical protein